MLVLLRVISFHLTTREARNSTVEWTEKEA